MAYTVYDLDDLQQRMVDRWDGVPFWDLEEARTAINEGLLIWNSMTGFWKRRITMPTVIGQQDYTLPATMVFGMRVEYASSPLSPTSTHQMDNGYPGWQGQTGTPKKWMPVDLTHIRLWPAPLAVATLTIDGVSATPQIVYDGDTVDLGTVHLNAILGYALHIIALKEGGDRFAATQKYFEDFLSAAKEENSQLEKSSMFRKFLGLDMKRSEQATR